MSAREHEELPGCTAFEATMALVDGLLSGAEAARASAHAAACALCGPLASGWLATAGALRGGLEEAAELAKPELAALTDRVMAQVRRPARAEGAGALGWLWRLLGALEAPVAAVAAAGAIALVMGPVLAPAPAGEAHEPELTELAELDDESLEGTGPNGCSVDELTFEGADGMLMTAGDDMTVIWVSERDGA
jgi:hypothetical protein